jgi:hypothetical protein
MISSSTSVMHDSMSMPFNNQPNQQPASPGDVLKARKIKFEQLCQPHDMQHNLANEQEKLDIAHELQEHLAKIYHFPLKQSQHKSQEQWWWQWSKWILFGVLISGGLMYNGFDDFLGGQSLLDLIPGLSNSLVFGLSVVACLLDAILYYAFQTNIIRKELELASFSQSKSLLEIYSEQIEVANNINKILFDVKDVAKISAPDYFQYCCFAKCLNQDIAHKNSKIQYSEDSLTKFLRWSLIGFGAFMSAGGTYFTAVSFLTAAAPALIGTTIGGGISLFLVMVSVLNSCATQADSLFSLLNPTLRKFESVKEELEAFEVKTDADFDAAMKLKDDIYMAQAINTTLIKDLEAVAVPERLCFASPFFSSASPASTHRFNSQITENDIKKSPTP